MPANRSDYDHKRRRNDRPGYSDTVRSTIITGASRGLGAALVDECLLAGDRVLALSRRFRDHPPADGSLSGRPPPDRLVLRPADLADPASLPTAAELATFLGRDPASAIMLVHNAGVFEPFGPIGSLDAAAVRTAVAVNLTAPMLLTNTLLSCPLRDRQLTVVYISSSAAHQVGGGRSVYGSTKRAGELFFETLAMEHQDDPRVRVIIADPGIMDTDMQATVREHALHDAYFPGRERFIARHQRGELPSPARVARQLLTSWRQ